MKKLSAYVAKHGINSFTFEDFLFVGSKVAEQPARLILVGGQALEAWAHLFDVPSPLGPQHPLTEDTDWLGGPEDAKWLCDLLGADQTELQLASMDDAGPSTALAYLRRPDGRVLMMDFLRGIVGPENDKVQSTAVPVKVEGFVLHILHPLLCLESRLANLKHIPAKRKGNGPLQAKWAIDIARAYIRARFDKQKPRATTRRMHRIAELAEYKSGPYCYLNFGLDPLLAVDNDLVDEIGGSFSAKDWPMTQERILRKRDRWKQRAAVAAPGDAQGAEVD